MAAFAKLDWRRLDVWAIVGSGGLVVIDLWQRISCQAWLTRNDYGIKTLDFGGDTSRIISDLEHLLDWKGQFGYVLGLSKPNLNALRDGFRFDTSEAHGCVLEITGADRVWQEDPEWLLGLLAIAQEHCREHLALGHRFFTTLVLPENSPLIGVPIEETRVPAMFWSPYKQRHEFRG